VLQLAQQQLVLAQEFEQQVGLLQVRQLRVQVRQLRQQ
jgi:hypothetical protein